MPTITDDKVPLWWCTHDSDHRDPDTGEILLDDAVKPVPHDKITSKVMVAVNLGSYRWRAYDDDGRLMCAGVAMLHPDATGFEPLDDYAMPNFGCTYLMTDDGPNGWAIL